jgi:hypothetical protein
MPERGEGQRTGIRRRRRRRRLKRQMIWVSQPFAEYYMSRSQGVNREIVFCTYFVCGCTGHQELINFVIGVYLFLFF